MLPVAARWQPPETGQSIASAPSASTRAASRSASAASVVLISSQIFPGDSPASTPPAASITSADTAGEGRQVMTTSTASASARGPAAAPAPRLTKAATRRGSRSRTVSATPCRSRLPASWPPTLPRPMNPTRISDMAAPRCARPLLRSIGTQPQQILRPAARCLRGRGAQCSLPLGGGRDHGGEMIKLLGMSGSLRRGSYNALLLRAATQLMPPDSTLEVASIRGIPLYDADVEAQGMPPTVVQLKEAVVAADGVLLVTPEYNNSIPGVFKNAIDWLSRPPADIKRVFGGRPFAVMGASNGYFGTLLSQTAWLPVLRTLGTQTWFGARLTVSRAGGVFDESGALKDAAVEEQLKKFLEGYVAFVRRTAPER